MRILDLRRSFREKSDRSIRVYHVTPKKNLANIRVNGLVPQIGPNSKEIGETEKAVHVFLDQNSLIDAMMNWESMDWHDEEEPELSLLTLTVPASMLSTPFNKGVVGSSGAAEIHQTVPPSMITSVSEVY
jgi:hypothetical protein